MFASAMNWKTLPLILVAVPATVHSFIGNSRFVLDSTVKLAAGLLVKVNSSPPFTKLRLVSTGGVAATGGWLTATETPNTVRWATRFVAVLLAVKL